MYLRDISDGTPIRTAGFFDDVDWSFELGTKKEEPKPEPQTASGMNTNTLLIIGAVAVVVIFVFMKK